MNHMFDLPKHRSLRFLIGVVFGLAVGLPAMAMGAHTDRTRLHSVDVGSEESADIVDAQFNWMLQDPVVRAAAGGGNVLVQPISIKRNDKYAYLVARAQGVPKTPYLVAVLELRNGHWVSDGYVGYASMPTGSIQEMCRYGEGVSKLVFRECGRPRRP